MKYYTIVGVCPFFHFLKDMRSNCLLPVQSNVTQNTSLSLERSSRDFFSLPTNQIGKLLSVLTNCYQESLAYYYDTAVIPYYRFRYRLCVLMILPFAVYSIHSHTLLTRNHISLLESATATWCGIHIQSGCITGNRQGMQGTVNPLRTDREAQFFGNHTGQEFRHRRGKRHDINGCAHG